MNPQDEQLSEQEKIELLRKKRYGIITSRRFRRWVEHIKHELNKIILNNGK